MRDYLIKYYDNKRERRYHTMGTNAHDLASLLQKMHRQKDEAVENINIFPRLIKPLTEKLLPWLFLKT